MGTLTLILSKSSLFHVFSIYFILLGLNSFVNISCLFDPYSSSIRFHSSSLISGCSHSQSISFLSAGYSFFPSSPLSSQSTPTSSASASFAPAFLFSWNFPRSSILICGCEMSARLDSSNMLSPFSSLAIFRRRPASLFTMSLSSLRTAYSTLSSLLK